MPVQPLKSADPLFKSGSGDHLLPASQKFGDLNLGESAYQDIPSNELMGDIFENDPFKWYPDAERLITDLVSGNLSLYDEELQKRLMNWMSDEQYNEFIDLNSGEKIYGLIKRRGNKAYAAKKTDQKSKLCRALLH